MKQFLLRIHYLITNPSAFVLSYTLESKQAVFQFFLMVVIVMTMVTAMIRTTAIIQDLPEDIAGAFPGVTIENGVLKSENGIIVPDQWRIADIMSKVNGRYVSPELYPESLVVVDPDRLNDAPILLSRDSIIITIASEQDTIVLPLDWSSVLADGTINFTESGLSAYLKRSTISIFIGTLTSLIIATVVDLLMYWIMLLLLILIYRRELIQIWKKGSTIKIIMNATIPYFIFMPIFAISGERSDYLSTLAIIVSTVIVFRAFYHHRITYYDVTHDKNKDNG